MWNIEIGEPVPGTWEPLSSVLANADVETSWQHGVGCDDKSPNGECAYFQNCVGPRDSQSASVSCIPKTAWIFWKATAIQHEGLVSQGLLVNADLTRYVIGTKPSAKTWSYA